MRHQYCIIRLEQACHTCLLHEYLHSASHRSVERLELEDVLPSSPEQVGWVVDGEGESARVLVEVWTPDVIACCKAVDGHKTHFQSCPTTLCRHSATVVVRDRGEQWY